MGEKIEFWDVECVVKQYGIIDKVTFWNGKLRQDGKTGWRCLKVDEFSHVIRLDPFSSEAILKVFMTQKTFIELFFCKISNILVIVEHRISIIS